eukprot:12694805-Alexandrium_andersonii.AAC.1
MRPGRLMTPAPRSARLSGTSRPRPWTPSAGLLPLAARPGAGTFTLPPGPPSLASGPRQRSGARRLGTASSMHGGHANSSAQGAQSSPSTAATWRLAHW